MTLIVNLFGGPCAGKSTTRARVFSHLKVAGINCEEVIEYAKDLTWEERKIALACQPYVFGKQLRNVERLIGKVDVIITDSPILLSSYYGRLTGKYNENFYDFIVSHFKSMGGLNYFLKRAHPYNPSGRNQTEAEADAAAMAIELMLIAERIDYHTFYGSDSAAMIIAMDVMECLLGKSPILDPKATLTFGTTGSSEVTATWMNTMQADLSQINYSVVQPAFSSTPSTILSSSICT